MLEKKRRDIAARRQIPPEENQNEEMVDEDLHNVEDMHVDPDVLPQRSPSPPPRASGRPNRRIRLPRCYQDDLPPNPNPPIIPIPEANDEPIQPAECASPVPQVPPAKSSLFCTEKNSFGI